MQQERGHVIRMMACWFSWIDRAFVPAGLGDFPKALRYFAPAGTRACPTRTSCVSDEHELRLAFRLLLSASGAQDRRGQIPEIMEVLL